MNDEVAFIYDTRLPDGRVSTDFNTQLSAALLNDIQHNNPDVVEENGEDAGAVISGDDSEDASDIEEELIIEPNEALDNADDGIDEGDVGETQATQQR